MFKDELLASDVSERQITFINFEEPEMVTAAYKWREVYDEILAKLQPRHMNYIFLDEVQAVDGWEKMVDGLHAKKITTVMVKDVIARQGGGNVKTATNIMWFMLDNIGNITSPKSISDTMTANHQAVSRPTVVNYLSALEERYLLYSVGRFDIKGKKLLQNLEKYYAVDTGLRKVVLGSKAEVDMGRILENIVYLELLRRENTVRIGRAGEKEIDFVVVDKTGMASYYQVALLVRDEKTLKRELTSLRGIDDNAKYLLTLDPEERDFDGIRQTNIIKWLLGEYRHSSFI